jgi:hypothetical protein
MNPKRTLDQTNSRIEEIIDAVLERGYDDNAVQSDDYDHLLERYEFRNLVIFEVYNAYFHPERHEFDLSLVTELVNGLLASRQAIVIGNYALSGVVGRASYEILKSLLQRILKKFSGHNQRQEPFIEINENAEKIVAFFKERDQATVRQIADSIDVDEEKILPLLKLLGYRCRRRRKKSVWFRKE